MLFNGVTPLTVITSYSIHYTKLYETRVRIKSKWYKSDQPKAPEAVASVLAFNGWKIAMNRLEHLESEGFPITDNRQRFGIVMEFLAFQLQAADRTAYEYLEDEDRQRLVTAMALRFADIIEENLRELAGRITSYNVCYTKLLRRF